MVHELFAREPRQEPHPGPLLRIVRVRWKIVAVAGWLFFPWLLLPLAQVNDVLHQIVAQSVSLVILALGVRAFRGRDEAVAPPRAWWRATARPTAGYLIAGFHLLGIFSVAVDTLAQQSQILLTGWIALAVIALYSLVVATFYLQSSVRLSRARRRGAKREQNDAWKAYVARRDALS